MHQRCAGLHSASVAKQQGLSRQRQFLQSRRASKRRQLSGRALRMHSSSVAAAALPQMLALLMQ
jgi:hypothetical protein